MGEIADLSADDIKQIMLLVKSPFGAPNKHLFQIFSHQPDFFRRYPKWPKNVWCCQSITSGGIAFPHELECGKRVAYCEPVMGSYRIQQFGYPEYMPDWLVIGLLNHADYANLGITLEELLIWICNLLGDARALGIPIFMKSHKLWAELGIKVIKDFPK